MNEDGGESLSVHDSMNPWTLDPGRMSMGTTRLVLLGPHNGGSSLASVILIVTCR